MNKNRTNNEPPTFGDPMTQMYYEQVRTLGGYAAKYPQDFDEDQMWKVMRKLDAIFRQHMRSLIEEASVDLLVERSPSVHPAAQYIMDRLIRENEA